MLKYQESGYRNGRNKSFRFFTRPNEERSRVTAPGRDRRNSRMEDNSPWRILKKYS